MITGKHEELTQITKTHRCPEHPKLELTVAQHPQAGLVIRCGGNHYPEEVKRVPTLTQEIRAGADPGGPIADNIKRGLANPTAVGQPNLTAGVLEGIPRADLATGEVLDYARMQALANWARGLGLRPELGHVALMYGKPYVELSGYLYTARQRKTAFEMTSHPIVLEERPLYQIPEGAHAWLCNIKILPEGTRVMGIGIITVEEMTEASKRDPTRLRSPIVAAHPWQMAQKRAEHQALKRAFPLGEEVNNGNP